MWPDGLPDNPVVTAYQGGLDPSVVGPIQWEPDPDLPDLSLDLGSDVDPAGGAWLGLSGLLAWGLRRRDPTPAPPSR